MLFCLLTTQMRNVQQVHPGYIYNVIKSSGTVFSNCINSSPPLAYGADMGDLVVSPFIRNRVAIKIKIMLVSCRR